MIGYNLTDAQKQLLRELVQAREQNKLPEQFHVYGSAQRWFLYDWRGDDSPKISSLTIQALERAGFLSVEWHRTDRGNLSGADCTLTQEAIDAVHNNFTPPSEPLSPRQIAIGALISGGVSGGTVQATGVAGDNATISQVINDPELLRSQVEALSDKLLSEVKRSGDLQERALSEYSKALQELKEQIVADQPNHSIIRRALANVSLLGGIEGSLQLTERVWPILTLFLTLAVARGS